MGETRKGTIGFRPGQTDLNSMGLARFVYAVKVVPTIPSKSLHY